MGVVPFVFANGETRKTLNINAEDQFTIIGLNDLSPRKEVDLTITKKDGTTKVTKIIVAINTEKEVEYLKHGGILRYVMSII
jgi:aconitate hydratase